MSPFNARKALAGAPVIQRNGMAATVVGTLDGRIIVDMQVIDYDCDLLLAE